MQTNKIPPSDLNSKRISVSLSQESGAIKHIGFQVVWKGGVFRSQPGTKINIADPSTIITNESTWIPASNRSNGYCAFILLLVKSKAAASLGLTSFTMREFSKKCPANVLYNLLGKVFDEFVDNNPWVEQLGYWQMPISLNYDMRQFLIIHRLVERSKNQKLSTVSLVWNELELNHGLTVTLDGRNISDPKELVELGRVIDMTYFGVTPHSNIPRKDSTLIGRHLLLKQVFETVKKKRLCSLLGPGGVGKTRLAIGLDDFSEFHFAFTLFVSLGGLSKLAVALDVIIAIARAISFVDDATPIRSLENLVAWIKGKQSRILIIIDNCEHLNQPVRETIDSLLGDPACHLLHVLTTGRLPINSSFGDDPESIFSVPGLDFYSGDPFLIETRKLQTFASFRLFLSHFDFDTTNRQKTVAVTRICQEFKGIPLPIILAAKLAKSIDLESLVSTLPQDVMSINDESAAHEHQRLLASSIEWSISLLPNEECRNALLSFAYCVGTFTAIDALSLLKSALPLNDIQARNVLSTLVKHGLVDFESNTGLYTLLMPLREHLCLQLTQEPEREKALMMIYINCVERSIRSFPAEFEKQPHSSAIEEFSVKHENVCNALELAINGEFATAPAIQILKSVFPFWRYRSHLHIGRKYSSQVLLKIADASPDLFEVSYIAAYFAWAQGDYETAETLLKENPPMDVTTGGSITNLICRYWQLLGRTYDDTRRPVKALECFSKAEKMATLNSSNIDLANTLVSMGINLSESVKDSAALAASDFTSLDGPQQMLQKATEIARKEKQRDIESIALNNLAYIAFLKRDYLTSLNLYSSALNLRIEIGNLLGIAWTLEGIARLMGKTHRHHMCVKLFTSARSLRESIGADTALTMKSEFATIYANSMSELADDERLTSGIIKYENWQFGVRATQRWLRLLPKQSPWKC